MNKHKTEDYKISAVKYYLNNDKGDGYKKTYQIKTYMKKNRNVENYEQLEKNVENAIEKVKPENYNNYFQHAYGMNAKIEFIRKPSTRKRKLKIYK